MSLEEFVKRALQDIAGGLNKAITEGAVAVAYADRVGRSRCKWPAVLMGVR